MKGSDSMLGRSRYISTKRTNGWNMRKWNNNL